MKDSHMRSITQLKDFLKVGEGMVFSGGSIQEKYAWIDRVLWRLSYDRMRKKDKSVVKAYIMKMTGYSDAQVGRLIKRKKETKRITTRGGNRHTFPKKYGPMDVALLIKVDKAHGRLNGKATKKILKREYEIYGQEAYKTISKISSSHIYNIRNTRQYRSRLGTYENTA